MSNNLGEGSRISLSYGVRCASVLAVIPDEEARRRIVAARMLLGISQAEMTKRGKAAGLNAQELERTERGELPLTGPRRQVLAQVLQVPIGWFTARREEIVLPQIAKERAEDLLIAIHGVPGLPELPGGLGTKHLEPPHDGAHPEPSPNPAEADEGEGGG